MKLGIGYGEDTHRLTENRELVLGGVKIDYRMGLLGHSDADVLTHAVLDALLGAGALGDIGRLFPDSDDRYKGISSLVLLQKVASLLQENRLIIDHIDSTVIAQEPKLAPHIDTMRANLANVLHLDISAVSVKATTPEHTGPEGRLECITARAVALIHKASNDIVYV